jgi:hypothetical protein
MLRWRNMHQEHSLLIHPFPIFWKKKIALEIAPDVSSLNSSARPSTGPTMSQFWVQEWSHHS